MSNEPTPEGIATAANAITASWPAATAEQRRDNLMHLVNLVIDKFYELPNNGAGGSLHVVLDDCNLDDESVDYCIGYALVRGDVAAIAVGRMLLALTYRERLECEFVCPCCIEQLRADCEAGRG